MKVLIDTNIILDVFLKRKPHFEASAALLKQFGPKLTGCISASQTTDIFYLLTQNGLNIDSARKALKKIPKMLRYWMYPPLM